MTCSDSEKKSEHMLILGSLTRIRLWNPIISIITRDLIVFGEEIRSYNLIMSDLIVPESLYFHSHLLTIIFLFNLGFFTYLSPGYV